MEKIRTADPSLRRRLIMLMYWRGRKLDIRRWFPQAADPKEVDAWREKKGMSVAAEVFAEPVVNYCAHCATQDTKNPRSHHPLCSNYKDLDEYPVYKNPLGKCPSCGDDENIGLYIESSREMQQSEIRCGEDGCDFHYWGRCDEETLLKRFRKKFAHD